MKIKNKPISMYSRVQLLEMLESKSVPNKEKQKIRNYLEM